MTELAEMLREDEMLDACGDYCTYIEEKYDRDCEQHCVLTEGGICLFSGFEKGLELENLYERLQTIKVDMVNHPSHYNREGAMETIDEMQLIFGSIATMNYCLLNAWKYRARALYKNKEEDLQKSDWYLRKYKELKEKLHGQDI